MSFTVSFNNTTYTLPSVKDRLYAANINTFLTSLANNALAKSGGNFTLTADVNWGASYGLISSYIKSRSSNISTTGVLRLANNEGIGFRNAANGADLLLKANTSDRLDYNGVVVPTISSTDTFTNKSISGSTNTLFNIAASSLASTTGSGAVVLATSPTITSATLVTPALGTPASGTLTNATGLPVSTGISGLGTGVATFLGTPSSANLAAAVTDETGSGSLVFATSPTLVTPTLGVASATSETITGTGGNGFVAVTEQSSAPSTPASGLVRVYAKTDKKLYTKDSAGTELQVGASGSGEINAITTGSTDNTGWTDGTSHTDATDTSNSPLSPVTTTCIAFTSSAAVTLGSQTSTSGSYKSITMPTGLLNRKLKVEFYFTTPASSAGTWAVSVYQGSTRLALSTDSSGDSILPSSVTGGKFTAYFDTSSSTAYTVNIVQRTRSSANTLYATSVIVGPGIQPQGAVVGEWQSFTPTFNNVSVTNQGSYWRRVGSEIEVKVQVAASADATGSVSWNMNGGLTGVTPDTSKFGNRQVFGSGVGYLGVNNYIFNPQFNGTNYQAEFIVDGTAVVLSNTNPSTDGGFDSGDRLMFEASYPVAEWAGSGTVNLAQNDVEYAYNTGTWDAADTSSFAYGPSGRVMGGSLTAERTKRVRFQSPIQPGDKIEVELSTDQRLWVTVAHAKTSAGQVSQGTILDSAAASAGIFWTYVSGSTTDVDIVFARYQTIYNGSSVINWPSDAYWRVRKSSAGAAVGFGLATTTSSGLVGTGTQSFAGDKTFTGRCNAGNSKVRAYLTGNTTITQNTDTEIVFNNDSTSGLGWDTNGEFNTSNGRFTPTKAGYYLVTVMIQMSGPGDGKYGNLYIYRNGTGGNRFGVTSDSLGSGSDVNTTCSGLVYCNGTTDYISVFVYHNGVSSTTLYGGTNSTAITIVEVM